MLLLFQGSRTTSCTHSGDKCNFRNSIELLYENKYSNSFTSKQFDLAFFSLKLALIKVELRLKLTN